MVIANSDGNGAKQRLAGQLVQNKRRDILKLRGFFVFIYSMREMMCEHICNFNMYFIFKRYTKEQGTHKKLSNPAKSLQFYNLVSKKFLFDEFMLPLNGKPYIIWDVYFQTPLFRIFWEIGISMHSHWKSPKESNGAFHFSYNPSKCLKILLQNYISFQS